ncbi:MAG TPA: ADOP family duplicated permease [Vicinamibacterales bacterium]|nr:ADOP family duplicated permease [Vicinamibacterales bacterium]
MTRDFLQALRMVRRTPLVAAVIIISLGIGIGANTTVFSWLQALVVHPLPGVAGSASLQFVEPKTDTGGYPGMSWREYQDLALRLTSFEDLFATRMVPLYVGDAATVERTFGELVSANYFRALGLHPALGRFFRDDEGARPGGDPVVVISHDFWQSHFQQAPDAIGRTLHVNDRDLTVIGVAPQAFQGTVLGLSFDLWLPATIAPVIFAGSRELDDRAIRGYAVMGRPRAGVSQARITADAVAAMRELAAAYPETNGNLTAEVLSFWRALRGPQRFLISAVGFLQVVMLLLLLAVCGNTANLVLARATVRRREVGIRLALGARPARILRLLLIENVVLGTLGAGLGTVLAIWGTRALLVLPVTLGLPIRFQTGVDTMTLGFSALLGIASGLLFGAAPSLQLSQLDPQRALRAGDRGGRQTFLHRALMGVQVALALLVLVAAGLFYRSLDETRDIDPGFRAEGVLLAAYDLSGRSPTADTSRQFASRLLDELRTLPGVESAAIAASVPLDIHGLPARSFRVEGHARDDGQPDQAASNIVTAGYFAAMGVPILSGHDFAEFGDPAAPPQAIVNQAFLQQFLANAEPIGRRVQAGSGTYVIVGVVKTTVSNSFGEAPTPAIYFSYRDRPARSGEIHLRLRGATETAAAAGVRRIVRGLDPTLPVYNVRSLQEHIEKNLVLRRIPARMFVVLGPLMLVLAGIGIYAVVAYGVAQRTTEISVRQALGATPGGVVRQVMFETARVIAVGAIAGWTVAYLFTRVLLDLSGALTVLTLVPLALALVAALACWLPASRAAGAPLWAALKNE